MVQGLRYIDAALPWSARPKETILLRYQEAVPPRVDVSRILGAQLGVNVRDVRPDGVIRDDLVAGFPHAWRDRPRPHITVIRRARAVSAISASDWTVCLSHFGQLV